MTLGDLNTKNQLTFYFLNKNTYVALTLIYNNDLMIYCV
jgi:hypothetical protein